MLISVSALVIGLPGLSSLPMDKHEALVVQTSAEMLQRDDLIVPYFNHEPRLKKPPLSYWATLTVHALRAGSEQPVSLIDARLPSLAALLGTIVLLLGLAWRGGGRNAALCAAAIAVASPMLAYASHDARPDPLYAFLVFAGAAALTSPLLEPARNVKRSALTFRTYLGWLLWGLATIAKGPHMPLMVATGLLIFAAREHGSLRLAWAALRPLSGLILMALVSLPWWWFLQQRLDPQALSESQLGGTLYQPGLADLLLSYREILGVGLLFPWFALILLYFRESRTLLKTSPVARLCAYGYVVPLILMLFSSQHRWHYMLPVLPFLAVFCGLLAQRLADRRGFQPAFASVFAMLTLFFAANASFQWFWDDTRFANQWHLAPLAASSLGGIPIAATPEVDSVFQVAVATTRRHVRLLETQQALRSWQAELASNCGILLTTTDDPEQAWPATMLATWDDGSTQIVLQALGTHEACGQVIDVYREASAAS